MSKLDKVLKAIRSKCLDCCGGSRNLVEGCLIRDCSLYPYRNVSSLVDDNEPMNGQISMFETVKEQNNGKRLRNSVL